MAAGEAGERGEIDQPPDSDSEHVGGGIAIS